jgi:hypothetical protein
MSAGIYGNRSCRRRSRDLFLPHLGRQILPHSATISLCGWRRWLLCCVCFISFITAVTAGALVYHYRRWRYQFVVVIVVGGVSCRIEIVSYFFCSSICYPHFICIRTLVGLLSGVLFRFHSRVDCTGLFLGDISYYLH